MRTDDLRESPGFLHNLPELYREFSDRDPLLENAVMAVALAHHSNQGGSCDAALQARKLYGLSLSLLNEKLSGGNLQSETALIAVLFLNYYLVFGSESPTSDVWSIHSDALSTLIRTRGTSSQFLDPKIGGITRAAVYIAVYRNLTRRILPGAEVALLEKSLELYRDAIWAETTLALSRITRLSCQCDELLARDSQDVLASEAVVQLIFRMRDEDHRYPEKYDTMALDKTRLERSFFDIIWVNSWRAARITLLQSLIDLIIRADTQSELQFRLTDLERLRYAAEKSILTIVDEITTTTSSLLAEFEAKRLQANRDGTSIGCVAIAYFMSLAPLGVAIGVRGLSEEQRLHIAGQLAAASANIGLRRPIRERWRR
ncbi:uncharacterized protein RSE6_06972 [Rhynchosporium secalis]|uniref:Uncharacterized protein n=1 Tax=Rhynchosporium secalis TaxID=38038 RepID=A0A1E1MBS3_RHYSE|nr:uncharacterized protein RSE6_06972 [Rhynchosporium secalis]